MSPFIFLRYGDRGPALVYIPTSGGDHTEFERYGLPEDCAPWIGAGRVQVFSVDGFGPKCLFNDALSPQERIGCYARFERYAIEDALPSVLRETRRERLGVIGASYGAFVAANLFLKCPGTIEVAGGLGGVYSMEHRLGGYEGEEVRRHTPLSYLPAIEDPATLAALRATRGFHLHGAECDPWLPSTYRFARALEAGGIPHHLEILPAPADHHERWWKGQIRVFLDRCY